MGLRIRKSIRIAPGIRLNLSKRGGSVSLGGKGMTVNLSGKGTRTTVGLPGTGVSYSTYSPHKTLNDQGASTKANWLFPALLLLLLIGAATVFYT